MYTVAFRQVSERKIIFEDGWFFVDSSACSLNFTGLVFFDFSFNSVKMLVIVIQIERFFFYPVVKRKLLHK